MRWMVVIGSLALLFAVPAFAQDLPAVIDGPLTINGNFQVLGATQFRQQTVLQGSVLRAPNLPTAAPAQRCAIWVNNGVLNRTVCP